MWTDKPRPPCKSAAFAGGIRLSKNLVEFAPAGANEMSICFVRGRVPRTKHTTPGKCGICAQRAHKLCAQLGAALSNANPATRFAFESLSKSLLTSSRAPCKSAAFAGGAFFDPRRFFQRASFGTSRMLRLMRLRFSSTSSTTTFTTSPTLTASEGCLINLSQTFEICTSPS